MSPIDLTFDDFWASVSPHHGAGLLGFSIAPEEGERFDFVRGVAVDQVSQPTDLGAFLLAPFSNRIGNAQFVFDGATVQLAANFRDEPHAIHGVAWQKPFDVTAQDAASVSLLLKHTADASWPWNIEVRARYALDSSGLKCELVVRNCDARAMPAGLGFHPYFPRARQTHLKTDADAVVANGGDMLPTGLDRGHPVLETLRHGGALTLGVDNGLSGWREPAMITWPDAGWSLAIATQPATSWAVLYTPEDSEAFCFEPVTHQTNAVNGALPSVEDNGLRVLEPGRSMTLQLLLSPSRC